MASGGRYPGRALEPEAHFGRKLTVNPIREISTSEVQSALLPDMHSMDLIVPGARYRQYLQYALLCITSCAGERSLRDMSAAISGIRGVDCGAQVTERIQQCIPRDV